MSDWEVAVLDCRIMINYWANNTICISTIG
jgi:hypothetical protein